MTKCTKLNELIACYELLFCNICLCLNVAEKSHQYKVIVTKWYALSSKISDSAKCTPVKIRKQMKVKLLSTPSLDNQEIQLKYSY